MIKTLWRAIVTSLPLQRIVVAMQRGITAAVLGTMRTMTDDNVNVYFMT